MKQWLGRLIVLLVVFAASCSLIVGSAYADQSNSAHYEFINSEVGGGGLGTSSSSNYQSVLSTADNVDSSGSSDPSSADYTLQAGSQTPHLPTLSISIPSGNLSYNAPFSQTSTAYASTQFSIEDYTSYGYAVQIIGNTPHNGTHYIPAMSNGSSGATTSTPGFEQFGMNLVANTTPTVGSNPNYGQFGLTSALPTTNYNNPNNFYYPSTNNDTIINSPKSSGQINWTLSFIVNVGDLTPGGQYVSDQSIICTGTY